MFSSFKKNWPLWLTSLGILLYLCTGILFVLIREANVDEGWYLYASKLVYEGHAPYRDFAFTQTPLLPYIYGIPQLVLPGIYTGRFTTLIISGISLWLALRIANSLHNNIAGALTALLWGTFTFGIYFLTITKTYALTTLFFLFAIHTLIKPNTTRYKPALITLFVVLSVLTRLSALFFGIPLLIYAYRISSPKQKWTNTLILLAGILPVLSLILPNQEAAVWNLFLHHNDKWGQSLLGERLKIIFATHIPILALLFFPTYVFFGLMLIFFGKKTILEILRRRPDFTAAVIGLIAFLIPNLLTGDLYAEYYVPFLFSFFPLISTIVLATLKKAKKTEKILLFAAMASTFLLGLYQIRELPITTNPDQLPIEEIRETATFVRENSNPNDELFVMNALWISIDSRRYPLPNLALANFSYFHGDTSTAKKFKLVNDQMVLEYFDSSKPKIIILTDLDRKIMSGSRRIGEINWALQKNYSLIYEDLHFGDPPQKLEIYLRSTDMK